jgi:micrococcal nuclease
MNPFHFAWRLSFCLMVGSVGAGCGDENQNPGRCGVDRAVVKRIIDGDTIVLEGDERVRYLLVDTPEITNGKNDCYGAESRDYNSLLVLGQEVSLVYDEECRDMYDRLLAYVSIKDREVNSLLVERGYACVLFIPPDGQDRHAEFLALEEQAKAEKRGMWGACDVVTCEN